MTILLLGSKRVALILTFIAVFGFIALNSIGYSDVKTRVNKQFIHRTFYRSHSCIVKYINLKKSGSTMRLNNMDSFTVILRGPWDKDFVEIVFNGTREIKYLNSVFDSVKRRMVSYDILSQSPDTILEFYTDVDNLSMSLEDRLILLNINGFCVVGIFPVTTMILIEYGKDRRECITENFVDTVYVYFYQGDLILFYQNYETINRLSKEYGNKK